VGYEEGGQLTEKVRRKPFSVVLFDEIEKAHQEVYNTLLQVLEDGRLTDGQGRTVDFKNTVIIFTSNLGTQDISKAVGLGFAQSNDERSNYDRMKNKVEDELKKHFRPEFLNRIDDIIVFHQLTEDQIITMVDLMIGRVETQLASKDMAIELTPTAKKLLARRGFDPVLGARPLRRTIQREIEDQLSEKILFGEVEPGQIVVVDVEGFDPDAAEGSRTADDKAKFVFRWTWPSRATSELARAARNPNGPSGPLNRTGRSASRDGYRRAVLAAARSSSAARCLVFAVRSAARSNSAEASSRRPSFTSRSPRTVGSRW
jgi:ATP-dependent Clp protease ATP-binding subunit ClpC